jgi:hypothetical protein
VQVLQPQHVARDHPIDSVIGDIRSGVQTRSRLTMFCEHASFVSTIEPKKIEEALRDANWIMAMQEELNNFTRNDVWELVERPNDYNVIGTKWVFKNKQDQDDIVVRNKARLVAQGYTQVEGLDYDETCSRDKIGGNKDSIGLCLCTQHQIISNGCQKCISQWDHQ